jgi:uncharacterized protein YycO
VTSVRLVFTRRRHIGSLLLRTALWSAWSHCAIVDGDTVIEATVGHGVRFRPLADLLSESSDYQFISVPCPNPDAVIRAAFLEVGKPYDYLGVLGIGFRRRWQDDDSWFCSELIAHAFDSAGSPLFRTQHWRITPRDLFIPSYEIRA